MLNFYPGADEPEDRRPPLPADARTRWRRPMRTIPAGAGECDSREHAPVLPKAKPDAISKEQQGAGGDTNRRPPMAHRQGRRQRRA